MYSTRGKSQTPPTTRRNLLSHYNPTNTVPTLKPGSVFSSTNPDNPFPWKRRHTLGDLTHGHPQLKRSQSAFYSSQSMDTDDSGMDMTRDSFVDSDRSGSPTPSDRSDSSGRSFLTSETYQMVKDMDRQRDVGYQAGTTAHWQTKPAVDPALGSKPWFYRRYSHQVQSNQEEDDKMYSTIALRQRKTKPVTTEIDVEDVDDLHDEIKLFVEKEKQEKIARGEYTEPRADFEEMTTEDPDQSQNSIMGDSGYLTPYCASQAGDVSMDPIVIEVPHYNLDDLPIETVNPDDYPELVAEINNEILPYNLPTYKSEARVRVDTKQDEPRSKVNLVVLSRDQLDMLRKGRLNTQSLLHRPAVGPVGQDLLIDF